jgi:hypothetical protein
MAKRGRPKKDSTDNLEDTDNLETEDIDLEDTDNLEIEAPVEETKKVESKADGIMAAMMQSAEKKFGKKGIYIGADNETDMSGVELKPLALKWFMDSNVVVLGKILVVAGLRMSAKSAFSYYLADQFIGANGGAILVDTEGKVSPGLIKQISTHRDLLNTRYIYKSTTSIEEWCTAVNLFITNVEEANKRIKKDPAPIMLCVDSITGSASKDQHKDIIKSGSPKAGFDRSPILLTRQIKAMSDRLVGLPLTVVLNNHLKKDLSDQLGHAMRTPGGDAPGYHGSYELWFTGRKPIGNPSNPSGFVIKMVMKKNSLGACWRQLFVPFRWAVLPAGDNKVRRIAWFDWDFALSNLIVRTITDEPKFAQEILAVEIQGKEYDVDSAKIRCSDMGVNSYIPYSDFGKLLQTNEEFVEKFSSYFDIPKYECIRGS